MDQSGQSVATERPVAAGGGWIDLSMPVSEGIPRWNVRFESVYDTFAHKSSTITLPVHAATHLDAPLHYVPGGLSIDQFPLELAVSEALIVDLTHVEPNQCIEVADIVPRFPDDYPTTIILRTDWPRQALYQPGFWADAPFICEDVALWLGGKQIRMIGYDFPQEEAIKEMQKGDAGMDDFTVHQAFLTRGIWQIEYLVNLHLLGSARAHILVAPLPLVGLDGSPVRVLGRAL